ncbi:MAG TPA: ADP-ribosylation factor-like protein [Candidatus Lokiarchaeia archaeon]|nr:ADP-ribosylation factor-like protein [Candidatus Lokiarchaeia archaeon]
MPEQKKILFTGLAAAGKTSILRALDQDFIGMHQLTPTKGVEHSKIRIFGVDIFRWDLGGQDIYREKYLEDKERYFSGTNLIIYVIDIQEEDTKPNLEYLTEVFSALQEVSVSPIIAVFFHKYDPRILLTSPVHRERMVTYIEEIDGMKGDMQVWYYPTSIYDLPSLVTSFSHVFLQIFPQQELLAKTLSEIRVNMNTPALAVADTSPFIIAKDCASDIEEETVKEFERRLLGMTRQFKGKTSSTISWSIEPFSDTLSIVVFAFAVKSEVYVMTGLFEKDIFREDDSIRDFDGRAKEAIKSIKKILELFYA